MGTINQQKDNDKKKNINNLESDSKDTHYLAKDSYINKLVDNSFIAFKSIDEVLLLIYSNKNNSIICYDINNKRKMTEIKNAHKLEITNFRNYLDKINKRDLVMSISLDLNLKLWNVNNFECLYDNKMYNNFAILFKAAFLNDNNKIYIISIYYIVYTKIKPIAVYDLKGEKIKEIKESDCMTYFIDSYYDKKLSKNFIITGNRNVRAYDFNENKLFNIYDDDDAECHCSIKIFDKGEITKMIESSADGNIRIWNFHSGSLLDKIKVCEEWINGICLWNNDYVLVGCHDKKIKIIDLNKKIIIKDLNGHNDEVLTIKKINHPQYGECLISQGYKDDGIRIWINILDNKI